MQHPEALIATHDPVFQTEHGSLYQGDCLPWLNSIPDESVDMVFADPPFNLGKDYGKGISDEMKDHKYLEWSFSWLDECVRVLKPGGALLAFNLPRWCIDYGGHLNQAGMLFRHWIACRMPKSFPIPKRLSPSHYGLLYYTKGKPKTFNVIRQPIQTCRHCGGEVKDYGGHRKKLNPKGLRIQDVFDAPEEVFEEAPYALPAGVGWTRMDEIWEDVPPVRHGRYKHRDANALAPIMLERLVAMATDEGDLVIDPFGGTGTTYYAAEKKHRRWLGIELGDVQPIIDRMNDLLAGEHAEWETTARGGMTTNGRKPGQGQLDLLGHVEK